MASPSKKRLSPFFLLVTLLAILQRPRCGAQEVIPIGKRPVIILFLFRSSMVDTHLQLLIGPIFCAWGIHFDVCRWIRWQYEFPLIRSSRSFFFFIFKKANHNYYRFSLFNFFFCYCIIRWMILHEKTFVFLLCHPVVFFFFSFFKEKKTFVARFNFDDFNSVWWQAKILYSN